jgi:hypothetical protein
VEPREVLWPVEVVAEKRDPKGLLTGPNGESVPVYLVDSDEIRGLSAKSFHIFEDGVEQQIRHFSVERVAVSVASGNMGQREKYSCTPTGVWSGQDHQKIEVNEVEKQRQLHTYLLTYVPRSPRTGATKSG